MEKIGLIAGSKKFPIIFSEAAKSKNYSVIAIAIKGDTSPKLKRSVDKIYWLSLAEFARMFEIFKNEGITKIIMAGQISPYRLFSKEIAKDRELSSLLANIKDKKADTIFGEIARKLKDSGFEVINSTTFVEGLLPDKGILTKTQPDSSVWDDVNFGLDLARAVASLDIGQTVAVKSKAIVAVEALEGTDKLIRRAGRVAGRGITVVKVSRPNQDMRFDIPVVGFNTIKTLIKVNAKCLAIESNKTLFIDKEASLKLADQKGIAVLSV